MQSPEADLSLDRWVPHSTVYLTEITPRHSHPPEVHPEREREGPGRHRRGCARFAEETLRLRSQAVTTLRIYGREFWRSSPQKQLDQKMNSGRVAPVM
ncbi:hypothetical protein H920_15051 [Fukomys damarensis]|uniref:Uncharacterized protein n=1 Tax=Fukomys damarensis TaxID=885580 RepID=A0A091CV57_FUKDA|nr:hypothetical protein H920_15051 [Fukomys damarensis]